MINHNEPAFLCHAHDGHNGLTKREYFAAHVMQGLCADPRIKLTSKEAAEMAVKCADELIKELNKTEQ